MKLLSRAEFLPEAQHGRTYFHSPWAVSRNGFLGGCRTHDSWQLASSEPGLEKANLVSPKRAPILLFRTYLSLPLLF